MTRWMMVIPMVALAANSGAWLLEAAQSTPPAKPPEPNLLKLPSRKEAMEMKLRDSQKILEGIALNDFKKIEEAAAELIVVSNVTDFLNAFKGKEYQFHVEMFRRPAETIEKKAKEKNMDGVLVAYNELTLSCLKCHQAMRDKKFEVSAPLPDDRIQQGATR